MEISEIYQAWGLWIGRIYVIMVFMAASFAGCFSGGVVGEGFEVGEGLEVEKIVMDGLVRYPIEGDLGEDGSLYVTESSGSNQAVTEQVRERSHRLLRLTDMDKDGVYDRKTVFADNLMLPEGCLYYRGSVYVSAPPEIWKFTDRDGDGISDEREIWFDGKTLTGCANDLHGPYLGRDGWIYWTKGAFAEQQHTLTGGQSFVSRAAHVYRRRPEGGAIEPVMTGGMDNPVGLTFTSTGERIISTTFLQHPAGGNRDGLLHIIYGGVYGKEHGVIEGHVRTGSLMPVMTHLGPAAPVGIEYYNSRRLGGGYDNGVFVCQFNLRSLVFERLISEGATYRTEEMPVLKSEDFDFHPTDVFEDRDGSLIVIDTGGWYQLCCPTSSLRKNAAVGGIYRVSSLALGNKIPTGGGYESWESLKGVHPSGDSFKSYIHTLFKSSASQIRYEQEYAIEKLSQLELHPKEIDRYFNEYMESVAGARDNMEIAYVWMMTRINHPAAREICRSYILHENDEVSHAAIHSASVWRDRQCVRGLSGQLISRPASVQRVSLEALGRVVDFGDDRTIGEILKVAESPMDRVLEHSFMYALIEIQKRGGISERLLEILSESDHVDILKYVYESVVQSGRDFNLDQKVVERLLRCGDWELIDRILDHQANRHVGFNLQWTGLLDEYYHKYSQSGVQDLKDAEWKRIKVFIERSGGKEEIQNWLAQKMRAEHESGRTIKPLMLFLKDFNGSITNSNLWKVLVEVVNSEGVVSEDREYIHEIFRRHKEFSRSVSVDHYLMRRCMDVGSSDEFVLTYKGISWENLRAYSPSENDYKELEHSEEVVKHRLAEMELKEMSIRNRSEMVGILINEKMYPREVRGIFDGISYLSLLDRRKIWTYLARITEITDIDKEIVMNSLERVPHLHEDEVKELEQQGYILRNDIMMDVDKDKNDLILFPDLPAGVSDRGRQLFHSQRVGCINCHEIGYVGGEIGPDLSRIGAIRTSQDLLESIIYPSRSFVRSYETTEIETVSGELFMGVIKSETSDSYRIMDAGGLMHEVFKDQVEELTNGSVSLMPHGYGELLSRQELSDIISYLGSSGK